MAGSGRNPSPAYQLKRLTWVHDGRKMEACFRVGGGHPIRVPCEAELPGVGDVVSKATSAAGLKPCPGCERRHQQLNRATPSWVRRWLSALGLRPAGRKPDHHVQHQGKRQDRQAPTDGQQP